MNAAELASVTADLQRDEGLRLLVYDDATGKPLTPGMTVIGHPTIAYGRALDVRGITAGEAAAWLSDDIAAFDSELTQRLPVYATLNLVRQRVMIEMAFNLGVVGLLQFHNMLDALARGDWLHASAEMICSHWFKQVGDRARRLSALMRTGVDDE